MAKSPTLSLVEEEPQVIESTAEVIEDAQPVQEAVPTQDVHALTQRVARLEASLRELEARLSQVEQKAHTEHQLEIGSTEIAAIGNALTPHVKHTIIDHLKEHLGIAPPAIKGS